MNIYYHTTVSAGGDVSRAREFEIGKIPVNLTANLNANLNATGDLGIVIPSYVFATPVLGGQLAVGAIASYGRVSTSLAGTLTGALTTPVRQHPVRPAIRQHQQLGVGLRRSAPDGVAAVEQRRSQRT